MMLLTFYKIVATPNLVLTKSIEGDVMQQRPTVSYLDSLSKPVQPNTTLSPSSLINAE